MAVHGFWPDRRRLDTENGWVMVEKTFAEEECFFTSAFDKRSSRRFGFTPHLLGLIQANLKHFPK
jgi:hypothetical protein